MSIIIQTQQLTRRFGDFTAVDHLDLEVYSGQVVGYLGPNGSGKTTTIRMLLGMLRPSEGQAQVLGYDIVTQAEAIRARCGYMSQKFSLYHELTVRENLAFYAGVYGVDKRQNIEQVMQRLDLMQVEKEQVQNLSAGWRQRLALATAIVHRPGLLFLDEPTSGVDPVARRAFWNIIYELAADGITIMVTTHYMDEAEYCSVVGIMRAGKLLAMDEPDHLRANLKGKIWNINCESLVEALSVLEAMPGALYVSHAGDHIRVIASPDIEQTAIKNVLDKAAIADVAIRQGNASMEDVFMLSQ